MKYCSTPQEVIAEFRRLAEEGEPITLVPINDDGEPSGEPPITEPLMTAVPEPQGRRLK